MTRDEARRFFKSERALLNPNDLIGKTWCEAFDMAIKAFKEPETNADRIRAMSDEELAKTISGDAIYPWCTEEEPCKYESCTDCVLAWLKQEVSDA